MAEVPRAMESALVASAPLPRAMLRVPSAHALLPPWNELPPGPKERMALPWKVALLETGLMFVTLDVKPLVRATALAPRRGPLNWTAPATYCCGLAPLLRWLERVA